MHFLGALDFFNEQIGDFSGDEIRVSFGLLGKGLVLVGVVGNVDAHDARRYVSAVHDGGQEEDVEDV